MLADFFAIATPFIMTPFIMLGIYGVIFKPCHIQTQQEKASEECQKIKTLVITTQGEYGTGEKQRRFIDLQDLSEFLLKPFYDKKILPECEIIKYDTEKQQLMFLRFNYWENVITIEDERGFLYSNGDKTYGTKHISQEIMEWVEDLQKGWDALREGKKEVYLVP